MDKRIKIFFVVCFSAFASSFVIQTVFQKILAGDLSVWGGNPGWQREIAFWNVCCGIIAILQLKFATNKSALPIIIGFTVLFALLGTNHLFSLFIDPASKFHWPPFVCNYIGLAFGVKILVQYRLRRFSLD